MRLRWFPDNSVALCADNSSLFSRFYFDPTALFDEVGFSLYFVFLIIITDYKSVYKLRNTADICNASTCKTARNFSQEVTGRKNSLQNHWLIFHKGVRERYLFV